MLQDGESLHVIGDEDFDRAFVRFESSRKAGTSPESRRSKFTSYFFPSEALHDLGALAHLAVALARGGVLDSPRFSSMSVDMIK